MDVRQLEYFLAVVDSDGFTRAAGALYVSQSAISQAVRGLETELGVELFQRVGRRSVLSDAGRELVGPARDVVRACQSVREAASGSAELRAGEVRLVAQESPGIGPLAEMISDFHARHPQVRVSVLAARRPDEVLEAVASGRGDLGLATFIDPPVSTVVDSYPLFAQEMVVISPPGRGLARDGARVRAEELNGLPFILGQPGTRMRALADRMLAEGIELAPQVETELRGTLVALVLAGVGHSLIPEPWGRVAQRLGAELAYLEPAERLPLWALAHRASTTRSARAFLAVVRAASEKATDQ